LNPQGRDWQRRLVARCVYRNRNARRLFQRAMVRKLSDGRYRLYSRKKDPKTGRRRNLGTFKTRDAAKKHERDVQYFERH
jgi:hypothetical protein